MIENLNIDPAWNGDLLNNHKGKITLCDISKEVLKMTRHISGLLIIMQHY